MDVGPAASLHPQRLDDGPRAGRERGSSYQPRHGRDLQHPGHRHQPVPVPVSRRGQGHQHQQSGESEQQVQRPASPSRPQPRRGPGGQQPQRHPCGHADQQRAKAALPTTDAPPCSTSHQHVAAQHVGSERVPGAWRLRRQRVFPPVGASLCRPSAPATAVKHAARTSSTSRDPRTAAGLSRRRALRRQLFFRRGLRRHLPARRQPVRRPGPPTRFTATAVPANKQRVRSAPVDASPFCTASTKPLPSPLHS